MFLVFSYLSNNIIIAIFLTKNDFIIHDYTVLKGRICINKTWRNINDRSVLSTYSEPDTMCLPWITIINAHNMLLKVDANISILQKMKMRLKEVYKFIQTHTAKNFWDSNLSLIWVLPLTLNIWPNEQRRREWIIQESFQIGNGRHYRTFQCIRKEVGRWEGLQETPVTSLHFIGLKYWIKLAFHF